MELTSYERYLMIPENPGAQERRLRLFQGERLVCDLDVRLDLAHPTCEFPVDLERFGGRPLRLEVDGFALTAPSGACPLRTVAERADGYEGRLRPLAHVTARRGWLNDPNGLAHVDGRYLLFFQHNPVGCAWGNMHWGRAEGADLVHWREGDVAFFPDERGTAYSGCAFVDEENASGLGEGGRPPLLLYHTRAGDTSELSAGRPFTQNLAYSTDGGRIFREYDANPILPEFAPGNRDPKVIRHEASGRYVMALYLGDRWFALFGSRDLLHWDELQRLRFEGDAECPDFYPLAVDGDPHDVRWVLSAASDHYLIGSFDGERFAPHTTELALKHGPGKMSYAAQSWTQLPPGPGTGGLPRRVRMAFSYQMPAGEPWASCLTLPQEMRLATIDGEARLCAWPAAEVRGLYRDGPKVWRDATRMAEELPARAVDLELRVPAGASAALSFRGLELRYDAAERELRMESAQGPVTAPVAPVGGEVRIRAIVDTVFAEVFAMGGSVYAGLALDPEAIGGTAPAPLLAEASGAPFTLTAAELGAFWR